MSTAFSRIAPHYELLMASVPYGMWISYLKLIWAKLEARPQAVLDIACGTGTMCRILASEGITMTGVDLSPEMIGQAIMLAESEGRSISFLVEDARSLPFESQFDAAYSFFDSLNNLVEPAGFLSALTSARRSLKPGSPFLFDLNTAYAFEEKMFDQKEQNSTKPIRYRWTSDWDPMTSICTIEMRFTVSHEEWTEIHRQRAYDESEVRHAMDASGFTRVQVLDAYTLSPPRKSSDRIHVLGIAE